MECLQQVLQQVHLALTMKVSETANVVETSQRNINITFFQQTFSYFPQRCELIQLMRSTLQAKNRILYPSASGWHAVTYLFYF